MVTGMTTILSGLQFVCFMISFFVACQSQHMDGLSDNAVLCTEIAMHIIESMYSVPIFIVELQN